MSPARREAISSSTQTTAVRAERLRPLHAVLWSHLHVARETGARAYLCEHTPVRTHTHTNSLDSLTQDIGQRVLFVFQAIVISLFGFEFCELIDISIQKKG